tara:strand:- start:174 stop:788 length:615 start_codon:yes stop_codon:yes gene_type:complete
MNLLHTCLRLIVAAILTASSGIAYASNLTVQVNASNRAPLEDVVVYLISNKTTAISVPGPRPEIQQINKAFVPLVSVVQTGSLVDFPNKDKFRHHVYSFSEAKKFEIKLYADTPSKPILFDKPGYVVMGCNIHDNMISHLLIIDTPYFAKSDARGRAMISNVPNGDYSLIAWYYQRPDKNALTLPVSVKTDATQMLVIDASPGI